MRPATLALFLVVAAVAGGCGSSPQGPAAAQIVFRTGSGEVRSGRLEIARTPGDRAHGLMGRTSLAADGGMVFLFDGSTRSPFWMKDTPIPLSIAFWDGDGRIVDILEMEPCEKDPCPLYRPRANYVAALEMNLGWFDRHGVEIGDDVELEPAGR